MTAPIKLRDTLALLLAIDLGAIALGESISADLHVPAARIMAAECQGFEALATVGGRPLTCTPQVATVDPRAAIAADGAVDVSAVPPVIASRA